jgi:hypothetical protein
MFAKREEHSMSERRKEPRRRLTAFTPVYDLHPRLLLGYLGDLTLRGAMAVGTNLTTINKQTTLEIEFPSELPGIRVISVEIPARIAWCRQEAKPQYFNIGVEFTEVTPENAELIEQMIARYHFRHALSDADIDSK